VGAANTLFSYLLFIFLTKFIGYLPAYSIAYCAGIFFSYFLNVHFVFRKRVSLFGFLKFPVVYVIQYLLGVFLLWLLVGKGGVSPELAMIGVIIFTIPVTFLASRFILKN
jgi:putative flippase GtrA